MIRLILMDVDGTLVGADGVPASVWPALDEARARGVHLGLSTGRIGRGLAEDYARRVSEDGLHVFQNGAVISPAGRPAARAIPIARPTFLALIALSHECGRPLEAYGERNFYLEYHTELTRLHARELGFEPEVRELTTIAEPIVRAQWVIPQSEWPPLRERTAKLPGLEIHPATGPWAPGTYFVNLTAPGATKVAALRWLAEHHGLDPQEVAMVGDAENDLEAMDAAGLGIAMGNGSERVRTSADAVVADVDRDGLAEAVRLALAAR